MSYDFKGKEEKAKLIANNKGRAPKTIHVIMSIIYLPVIILIIPYILSSITAGYFDLRAYVAEALIIGSIFISRILIDRKKILIAFLILLSVPGLAFLYFLPGHM